MAGGQVLVCLLIWLRLELARQAASGIHRAWPIYSINTVASCWVRRWKGRELRWLVPRDPISKEELFVRIPGMTSRVGRPGVSEILVAIPANSFVT
jgi:hypothetical protein